MLFRKKIERSCQYCACAAKLAEGGYLCSKRGVIDGENPAGNLSTTPASAFPPSRSP